jgi:putative oxidoreductase
MKHLISGNWAAKWEHQAIFVLRVSAGLIFLSHGWSKWQAGVDQTGGFLAALNFPAPELFAPLLIAIEVLGGIALIVGAYTRLAAKLTGIVALIAIFTVHLDKGFSSTAGGYEYVLLLAAACFMILVTGAGAWSVDKKFLKM